MGWQEDLFNVGMNMVTFGAYGGTQLLMQSEREAEEKRRQEQAERESQRQKQLEQLKDALAAAERQKEGAAPNGFVPAPSPAQNCCCCDRFQLTDGMLLDRAMGRVWEYDKAARELIAIPVRVAPEHAKLAEMLLESRLSRIATSYSEEVLSKLPSKVRADNLKAFDEEYLEPLRAALRRAK